jgi:hypothetical protein
MKTLCNCGQIFDVSHTNVNKKIKINQTIGACDVCAKRWRYIDVKEFVEKKGCEIISIKQRGYDTYDYSNPPEQGRDAAGVINADKIQYIRVYGCPNAAQNPECQKRARETYTRIWGVDHNMKTLECRNKARQTNMANHGGRHNLSFYRYADVGMPIMIRQHGVPYAMQVKEFFHKAMKKSFSTKEYVFKSGRIEMIQGYEHFALNDLVDFGVDEDDILVGENVPYIDYYFSDEAGTDGASSSTTPTPKRRRYFPDIYVKARDDRCALIIEVKSKYTLERDLDKNIAKFDAVNEQHSGSDTLFAVWVYDRNGALTEFSNP